MQMEVYGQDTFQGQIWKDRGNNYSPPVKHDDRPFRYDISLVPVILDNNMIPAKFVD